MGIRVFMPLALWLSMSGCGLVGLFTAKDDAAKQVAAYEVEMKASAAEQNKKNFKSEYDREWFRYLGARFEFDVEEDGFQGYQVGVPAPTVQSAEYQSILKVHELVLAKFEKLDTQHKQLQEWAKTVLTPSDNDVRKQRDEIDQIHREMESAFNQLRSLRFQQERIKL